MEYVMWYVVYDTLSIVYVAWFVVHRLLPHLLEPIEPLLCLCIMPALAVAGFVPRTPRSPGTVVSVAGGSGDSETGGGVVSVGECSRRKRASTAPSAETAERGKPSSGNVLE